MSKIAVNMNVKYIRGNGTPRKARDMEREISKALQRLFDGMSLSGMPGLYLEIKSVGKVTLR